jgi:ankyrin repeat protein
MVDLLREDEKGKEGPEVEAKSKLRGRIAFTWAVARSRPDVVRSLLDKGFDVSADPSLLQGAVDSGNLEIVRLVLDKGADVNAIPVGFGRSTALSRAASKGHLEIARLLLDKGADVNGSAEGGFTALMETAGGGDPQMVELLLDKGADVNAKATDNVSTALNKARRHGHKKIEETLTAHGAKE